MRLSLVTRAGRRFPARIGATVCCLYGEGYGLDGRPRPRRLARYIAGEFGTIIGREDWGHGDIRYVVQLPPHPDHPDEGDRHFWLPRPYFVVCPSGAEPNTSAMDNHFIGWSGHIDLERLERKPR